MTRGHRISRSLSLLLLSGIVSACATMEPAPSLYKRLTVVDPTGTPQRGRAAIALMVDDFVANVVADPRVSGRFTSLPGPAVAKFKSCRWRRPWPARWRRNPRIAGSRPARCWKRWREAAGGGLSSPQAHRPSPPPIDLNFGPIYLSQAVATRN